MPCMQSLPGACAALRPINHRKDRLAGFRAVVCDPKLPSAKGSSWPKTDRHSKHPRLPIRALIRS